MNIINPLKNRARYYLSFVNTDLLALLENRLKKRPLNPEKALRAGYEWLCHAQDAFEDGGVARSYSLVVNPYFGLRGWVYSYPETTGYIIPTVFEYAKKTREGTLKSERLGEAMLGFLDAAGFFNFITPDFKGVLSKHRNKYEPEILEKLSLPYF